MKIPMKCPKCKKSWTYKPRTAQPPVFCTCPSCFSKCRVRALPDPGPRIVPAHFRAAPTSVLHSPEALADKMRAEKIRGRIGQHTGPKDDTCESVRGQVTVDAFGRPQEDVVVSAEPAHKVHSRTPFTPEELKAGHICDECGREIKAPKMGYWVDNLTLHSRCLVDKALQECGGDLQRAAQLYDLPLKALEKRTAILMSNGKLPVKANA